MAEARAKEAWGRTSVLAAVIANAHRDPKKRAYRPAEFSPYRADRREGLRITVDNIAVLRDVFVGRPKA